VETDPGAFRLCAWLNSHLKRDLRHVSATEHDPDRHYAQRDSQGQSHSIGLHGLNRDAPVIDNG
jgi:hypothetical protein